MILTLGITPKNYAPLGTSYDADAQAFITAAGITDATQKSAVNQLVLDLKGYSIWTKMKAIYPILGGSASSHAVNLKTPGTFNLIFSTGWTHSSTGITGNGSSAYADTQLNSFSNLTKLNTSISIYTRTNNDGLYVDINSANANSTEIIGMYNRYLNNFLGDTGNYTISRITTSNTNSTGFYQVVRTSLTSLKAYKNSSAIGTNTTSDNSNLPNFNIIISAANVGGNVQQYSNRQYAFASIGNGLTDTEAANFYTAVQNYQTTLSRNV